MNALQKFPVYVKASLILIGLYFFIHMLFIAKAIILPIIYATILAILISPAVNFLVKKRINRALSITGVLVMALLITAGIIALVASQASMFSEAWPRLVAKFHELVSQSVTWASGYFNISSLQINTWFSQEKDKFMSNSGTAIGFTISTMGGVLAAALLTPVYIFMILYYQPHLVAFTHKLFGVSNNRHVSEVLLETKTIVQSYLVGLFTEFAIVATLNSIGLLLLGIDYAILLGIIGALLNVVPFIGGALAAALFAVITLVTQSPIYVLYVIALNIFIQFIDNHYIVPKIVGAKVKLNALICLIAVIGGAALWGIPGMFLAIPLTAIIKLILDRFESLKPWGFLLGDTIQSSEKLKFGFTVKGFIRSLTVKKN